MSGCFYLLTLLPPILSLTLLPTNSPPTEPITSLTKPELVPKTGFNTGGATTLTIPPTAQPVPAPTKAPLSRPSVNNVPPATMPAFCHTLRPGASAPVMPAEHFPSNPSSCFHCLVCSGRTTDTYHWQ